MPRYLHTCYRIGDIDRSVAFYEKLGFQEARRMPIGDEAINVFMNMPGEDPVLELTYNHGVDSYELGTGYNHIALAVEDLGGTLDGLKADGIEPEKPPYRPGGRTDQLATDGRWTSRARRHAPSGSSRGQDVRQKDGRRPHEGLRGAFADSIEEGCEGSDGTDGRAEAYRG